MSLTPEAKKAIMAEFKLHESDTGSPEVQVAAEHEQEDWLRELGRERRRCGVTHKDLLGLIRTGGTTLLASGCTDEVWWRATATPIVGKSYFV